MSKKQFIEETKVSVTRETHKRLKEFCDANGLKIAFTADRFINEGLDRYWSNKSPLDTIKQPTLFDGEVNTID